jgi:type I restriction enzyme S subunit
LCETIYRYPSFYGIKWKKEGIPVLRGENIRDNNLLDEDSTHYNYIDKSISDKFPNTILREGDLVMCVRGSIGKIAIIGNNFAGANISPNLIRIAPIHKRINSRYLLYFLSSFVTKEFFLEHTKAATISTIKASDLKNLQIPLPPLPEQKKIVVYLDDLREKVEKLKQLQQNQLEELIELKNSILNKAFKGELI